jgi:hypothetical protein
MKDDNANNEPTAKILSFPTEQRRVSVATEREDGMMFTPEHLKSLLNFDDLIKIDLDRLDLTIQSDHDSFTYNWNEFMEGVDLTKEPDRTIFSRPQEPYTETLKTVTSLLVEVHRLNSLSKDSQLDELNHHLKDLLSWLKDI